MKMRPARANRELQAIDFLGGYWLAVGGSNRLLNIPHAAELLDVPVRRLRDQWRAWGIPAFRVGRELRFRERDLWAWIEKQAI